MKQKTALCLGAGGFICSHLIKRLKSEGYWVRGVDLKYPEFSDTEADDFVIKDLRDPRNVESVLRLQVADFDGHDLPLPYTYLPKEFVPQKPFDEVYQLAADMGGAGYVFTGEHDAEIMHNSAMINLNVCNYVDKKSKVFYSSSACMYPQEKQDKNNSFNTGWIRNNETGEVRTIHSGLRESDAYPANPDSEYGWEKLFSERLYLAYARNYGLNVRIARFHNIYGPEGTYTGGREKAPAAMCRKAIESEKAFSIWGDGNQTRSFLYIDDCIDAVRLLMQSDFKEPINIGSEEMVSIRELAQMAILFSGKNLYIDYEPDAKAVGVRGRNSDNTLIKQVLNWEPKFTLERGLIRTYRWIKSQYDGL